MFRALGFTKRDAPGALRPPDQRLLPGAPPHGGLAYGLTGCVCLMVSAESIRDVIAFQGSEASEPMTSRPDFVDDKQLTS